MRNRFAPPRALAPLALFAALAAGGCAELATAPESAVPPRHDVVALAGGLTVYTDRSAWEAAVAAASASVTNFDFTGLTLGRITQLDTDYGTFRIVVDHVSATEFSNPGIAIFPDASCSLGTGDCDVFTFNLRDPTTTFDMPALNQLVFDDPIVAFGGDFIQVGITAPAPGTVTGPVTLQLGTETVVLNGHLDAAGNGFFGFVASAPGTTVSFTFAKSGSLVNDIFQVYNPAYAVAPASQEPTPEEAIGELRALLPDLGLEKGMASSVDAKLRTALDALAAGNTAGACSALQDLVNHMRAQSGKHVPADDAALLIAEATAIMTALGC